MARRSKGKISKRSRLLKKKSGEKLGLSKLLKSFKTGDEVKIDLKVGYSGMPHPRYRGKHGKVLEKRGRAYVVQIKDGNAVKELIIPGVHLEK